VLFADCFQIELPDTKIDKIVNLMDLNLRLDKKLKIQVLFSFLKIENSVTWSWTGAYD